MLPGVADRRVDAAEGDAQLALMAEAFAQLGRRMEVVQWDGEGIDWSLFEAAITSITWDYAARPAAFLDRLREISAATRLVNPLPVIEWNMQKHYLRDLAERGAGLVPTHWVEQATPEAARKAFAEFDTDRIVIKPVVGAGAWRQVLLREGELWPAEGLLPPGEAMIQPFLPAIQTDGEYSFIFFGTRFSHAVVKRPKTGDYRIQHSFGGTSTAYVPTEAELAAARTVLESVEHGLFHARVDMVRGTDGRMLLMELELIEPYLFVNDAPGFVEAFADGYEALLQPA